VEKLKGLRICYVLPTTRLGGSERHVMHLASGLRKRGHQTAILCVFQEGHDAEEVRRQGISLASLDLQQGWGPREFFRIFDWLRSNPVDVLHAYLFGFHVFAGLPARLLKVPVVLSSRREIAQWQKRRHLWVENMGNLLVDRVVSCSKAVEKWTLAKERISPEKVITIYNGINLGRFRPTGNRIKVRENLGIPLDAPLVGKFLRHIEEVRGNAIASRNVRLAAIHSFFRFLALREPACSGVIQGVLAIPTKRTDRRPVEYLTREDTHCRYVDLVGRYGVGATPPQA